MFRVFFTVEGVVARIVVPNTKGLYATSLYYVNAVLPEVFANFMEMSGRHTVRDVILYHDLTRQKLLKERKGPIAAISPLTAQI